MALQKQKVSFPFVAGMDKSAADALTALPSLLAAENVYIEKPGEIRKRFGIQEIGGSNVIATNQIATNTYAALGFANGSALVFGDFLDASTGYQTNETRTYFPLGQDKLLRGGIGCLSQVEVDDVSGISAPDNFGDYAFVDVAGNNSLIVVGISSTASKSEICTFKILDATTKSVLDSFSLGSASATNRFCMTQNNGFVFIFCHNDADANVALAVVDLSDGSVETDETFKTDRSYSTYDQVPSCAPVLGGNVAYFYVDSSGDLVALSVAPDLSIDSTVSRTISNFGYAIGSALIASPTGGYVLTAFWQDSSTGYLMVAYYTAYYNGTIATSGSVATISTSCASHYVQFATAIEAVRERQLASTPTTDTVFCVVYERYLNPNYDVVVLVFDRTAGAMAIDEVVLYNHRLRSKVFVVDDEPCFWASTQFPEDSTAFLIAIERTKAATGPYTSSSYPGEPRALAKALVGVAAGYRAANMSSVVEINGKPLAAFLRAIRSSGVTFNYDTFETALALVAVDTQSKTQRSVDVDGVAHISGAIPSTYDGEQFCELGFFHFPQAPTIAEGSTGAVFSSGATHSYKAVYEWRDAKGNLHKSAPSAAGEITLTANRGHLTVTVHCLHLTNRNPSSSVMVRLYRTTDDGATYYKCKAYEVVDASARTVDIMDQESDADIQDNETLYTTGGQVENIQPPPCFDIEKHADKLLIASSDDPSIVFASKPTAKRFGVSFYDAFYFDVLSSRVRAVRSMDGSILALTDSGCYVVNGSGWDAFGGGQGFGQPALIDSAGRPSQYAAAVKTRSGVIYHTPTGFEMVNRSRQVAAINRPDGLDSAGIINAIDASEQKLALWSNGDGSIIVYDSDHDSWYEWADIGQESIANVGGAVASVDSGGILSIMGSEHLDNGEAYAPKLSTGWIRLAQLQGFQRVYSVSILGDYLSPHILKVDVYVDDVESAPAEQLQFPVTSDAAPYQYSFKPSVQKCQSMRFDIWATDNSGSEETSENLRLTGIDFEIGIVGGHRRLPSVQRG